MLKGATTLAIMTLGVMTLDKTPLGIMTLSISIWYILLIMILSKK